MSISFFKSSTIFHDILEQNKIKLCYNQNKKVDLG